MNRSESVCNRESRGFPGRAWVVAALGGAFAIGCGASVPQELVDARSTYDAVSVSQEGRFAPTQVNRARSTLDEAERAFAEGRKHATRDLAYVATREAEEARVVGRTEIERRQLQDAQQQLALEEATEAARANRALSAAQRDLLEQQSRQTQSERALSEERERVRGELNAEREARQRQSEDLARARGQLDEARRSRLEAEENARVLSLSLGRGGSVRKEGGKVVVTLSGSVIFKSNEATLLPSARQRLDDVTDALATDSDQRIIVKGYTDGTGSEEHNISLSQARADAVMTYLIRRGVDADRIHAIGLGSQNPIADNTTPEGRAENRRVEIELAPPSARR